MRNYFVVLALSVISLSANAQTFTVSGYIKDKENGESLIGANVFGQPSLSGTSSNTYGFYSLTLPASDSITLIYSYVGYL